MPPYPWLISDDMDLSTVSRKFSVLASSPMYTPYTNAEIKNAEANARTDALRIATQLRTEMGTNADKLPAQLENKEVIALIAYLQRLGTDLKKSGKAH